MPSSHLHQINEIMELIFNSKPKSLLDIGVGFGKYGFLSREYLELGDGRQQYNDWKIQIDGIEVFTEYLTPIHKFIYNEIFEGNALDILPTLKTKYDLILLIDVLEHFDFEEGSKILSECMKRGRNIIISTPKDIGIQTDSFGNVYETHKFQWEVKHFEKFEKKFFVPNNISLICFLGEDALELEKKLIDNKKKKIDTTVKKKIKKNFPGLAKFYRSKVKK